MAQIPHSLQGVLWSSPVEKLDINEHKVYIIHQVLMYGDFKQIRWLFNTYSKKQIKEVFLAKPQKIYTKPALNYVSKFILELDSSQLSTDKYVNTLY
ncbi:hypothetical protein KKB40_01410 [Patescibacteria group bacterium]|nr:hypothetical protein [Patescibacteria group bacterium]